MSIIGDYINDLSEEKERLTQHEASVDGVAVDSDGYVYSGSSDDTVRKITPDGNEEWVFEGI